MRYDKGVPWERTDLVVRTVFKIAEVVARRLVGSIPTRSRQVSSRCRCQNEWRRPWWDGDCLRFQHFPYSLRFGKHRALGHERFSPFSTHCCTQSADGAGVLLPTGWFPRFRSGVGLWHSTFVWERRTRKTCAVGQQFVLQIRPPCSGIYVVHLLVVEVPASDVGCRVLAHG